MRLVFDLFLLLATVSAKLAIGDISRDQIFVPATDEDVSPCFDGSEHSALCITRAIRKTCIHNGKGENRLNLTCIKEKIHGMCNKQNELPQGDFQDCVYHFYTADLSLARDQCLQMNNPLSCFLHEAYYFCQGKFHCIHDSLEKICSSDCSDWKKVSTRMWLASTCKDNDCVAMTINDGCGYNKDCSITTLQIFCNLTHKLEQDAKNCITDNGKRIENIATGMNREPHENVVPLKPAQQVPQVPYYVEQPPYVPNWPAQGRNFAALPGGPNLVYPANDRTVGSERNALSFNETSEQTVKKEKFTFEKKHWVSICVCVGVSLLIVAAISFLMFWQARREHKKKSKGGDPEKAIDKKMDGKSNKSEKSKKEPSKVEKSKKQTCESKKGTSSKEKSKKEIGKSKKESKKESSKSRSKYTSSRTETSRKEEEKTENEESSRSDE